ncbi:aldo/keto reductase [Lacibacterium aquatile]|uniref:Aldo/keto reductase n=1 Tax=Lacibacterium aquatile TaxID=1168082 RepID=A0ABW5DM65_9PROT
MSLPTRPLGRTKIPVTTIGFGAVPIGDLYDRLDEATAIGAAVAALEAGINLLDTSPLYGHGLSEARCGSALRQVGRANVKREDVVLCTKVGRWMNPRGDRGNGSGYLGGLPHQANLDYSYDGTLRSVEQSLLRLGTDRIDILLIHDVDVWTHGKDAIEQRFSEAMNGAYKALDRLRADGTVKAIGVGINEADMCVRFANAGDFDTMLLAGRYSLLEQPAIDEFLPLALKKGIGVMLGGVFNSGILASGPIAGAKYNYGPAPAEILAKVGRIEAVCQSHGVPLATAALQFALGHPAVASVVLGAANAEEVARNLKGMSVVIPPGLWSDLKAESLLGADVPVPE